MNKFVYVLKDSNDQVVYVGESMAPKWRFYAHTKRKPQPGKGKFYGRTDLRYEIVAGPMSKPAALKLEGQLKLQYRLEWTERTCVANGGKIGGKLRRKLTMEQAAEIRRLYATGNYSYRKLDTMYGVVASGKIVRNLSYQEA